MVGLYVFDAFLRKSFFKFADGAGVDIGWRGRGNGANRTNKANRSNGANRVNRPNY